MMNRHTTDIDPRIRLGQYYDKYGIAYRIRTSQLCATWNLWKQGYPSHRSDGESSRSVCFSAPKNGSGDNHLARVRAGTTPPVLRDHAYRSRTSRGLHERV